MKRLLLSYLVCVCHLCRAAVINRPTNVSDIAFSSSLNLTNNLLSNGDNAIDRCTDDSSWIGSHTADYISGFCQSAAFKLFDTDYH